MNVLVDTNVVLDVLLKRQLFYDDSLAIFQLVDKDFEDAVQFMSAQESGADYIITRNNQDFSSGSIRAVTPEQFIMIIADMEQ